MVYRTIELISGLLTENPGLIPGQDGLVVALWLDRLYYDPEDKILYATENNDLQATREETELVVQLRKRHISPESMIKLTPLLKLIQEKGLDPEEVREVIKAAALERDAQGRKKGFEPEPGRRRKSAKRDKA